MTLEPHTSPTLEILGHTLMMRNRCVKRNKYWKRRDRGMPVRCSANILLQRGP